MSFARGISEYGSLVLLSGNLPNSTEVASVRVLSYIENGNEAAAASVAADPAGGGAGRHRRCSTSSSGGWPAVASDVLNAPVAPEEDGGSRLRTTHRRPVRAAARAARRALAAAPVTIGYVFFLVAWPTFLVFKNAFADGVGAVLEALPGPRSRTRALRLTAEITFFAVLINLFFGLTMSILLVRYEFPGKRVLSALIDVPLSVSPVVVGLSPAARLQRP